MQTFDICLGASQSDSAAPVLLTATDREHADAIVGAIQDAQRAGALFQAEGLVPFVRVSERAAAAPSDGLAPALTLSVADDAPSTPAA